MLRDITLGQYYPVDSVLHRMDPRTKLFGTLVYIVTLFIADSVWAYGLAALFLAAAIRMSRVPVKFMVRGLKSIVILLLISVSFNLFLTPGTPIFKIGFLQMTWEGLEFEMCRRDRTGSARRTVRTVISWMASPGPFPRQRALQRH